MGVGTAAHDAHDRANRATDATGATALATVIPFPGRHDAGEPSAPATKPPRPSRSLRRAPAPGRVRSCSRPVAGGASLRLTRRGRIVVTGLLLALMTIGIIAGASLARGAGPEGADTRKVLVQPGQTLWDIARTADPQADVRDTIERIGELNGLRSEGGVAAGDTLIVPVSR